MNIKLHVESGNALRDQARLSGLSAGQLTMRVPGENDQRHEGNEQEFLFFRQGGEVILHPQRRHERSEGERNETALLRHRRGGGKDQPEDEALTALRRVPPFRFEKGIKNQEAHRRGGNVHIPVKQPVAEQLFHHVAADHRREEEPAFPALKSQIKKH